MSISLLCVQPKQNVTSTKTGSMCTWLVAEGEKEGVKVLSVDLGDEQVSEEEVGVYGTSVGEDFRHCPLESRWRLCWVKEDAHL